MKNDIAISIIGLVLILIMADCSKSPSVIASVEDEQITTLEFKKFVSRKYNKNIGDVNIEQRKKAMLELIEMKMKVRKAMEMNLDKKEAFLKDIAQREERHIAAKLPEILITDQLVSEEMIKSYFELKHSKVKIGIIALVFQGVESRNSKRTLEETIDLAKKLSNKLKNEDSLRVISEKYSDYQNVKNNRGIWDPYTPGIFSPAVDISIYKAKENSIVGPLVTDKGVFVIKIFEKKANEEKGDFTLEKKKIKWKIYNKFYREIGDSLYKAHTAILKNELGWEIYNQGIKEFLDAIEQWSQKPNFTDHLFTLEQRAIVLGRIGDVDILSGRFVDEFQGKFARSYRGFNNMDGMRKILGDYIDRFLVWIKVAREKNIQNNPDVLEQMKQYKETELVKLFDNQEITAKSVPTSDEIVAYYEKNKKNYFVPRKIRIWEIAVKDEKLSQEIYEKSKKPNIDFEELAEKFTEKPRMKIRRGNLGYMSLDSPKEIVKKAFEVGPNQILGPHFEDDYYHIFKTGEINPEHQKSFVEVKNRIQADLRRDKEKQIKAGVSEQLKAEYDFWIDDRLIENLN